MKPLSGAIPGAARAIDIVLHLIETVFLTVFFSAMVLIIFAHLIFRGELLWAREVSLYLMMWLICFGASAAARNGSHISFELLERFMPPRAHRIIMSAMFGISSLLCLAAGVMGAHFVAESRRIGGISVVLKLPLWIVYLALPIAAVMLAVRFGLLTVIEPAPKNGADIMDK